MAVRSPARVYYPESDGKPLGETEVHAVCTAQLMLMLRAHFADRPDVWVAGDQMLYYVEGDPRQVTSPDVYVVFGRPKRPPRRVYQMWIEGPPTVVVEVSSRKTRREDLVTKRALYERLGVGEYFLFDPLDEYLVPRLQGLSLGPAGYEPIEPNDAGRIPSAALGLELAAREHELALYDPETARWVPTPEEETAARRAEEAARRVEEAARRAAEEEVARLRAEIAQIKGTDG
jgi:Uma2 family endonuclease